MARLVNGHDVPAWLTRAALFDQIGKRLVEWGGIAVGGYVAGAVLMGLYLVISCALLGRHGNEAFSALRIQDWKHVLRMRLTRTGLQVWAVALPRVSRFGPGRDGPALRRAGSPPVVIDRFAAPAAAPEARSPAGD